MRREMRMEVRSTSESLLEALHDSTWAKTKRKSPFLKCPGTPGLSLLSTNQEITPRRVFETWLSYTRGQ